MKTHHLFPYFLEKCLAIPTSPFFHLLVNGFCVTIIINLFFFYFNSDGIIDIKFMSMGSYYPEVHAFGTLITSTIVFRLIICKTI